jgi:hypothetical protein
MDGLIHGLIDWSFVDIKWEHKAQWKRRRRARYGLCSSQYHASSRVRVVSKVSIKARSQARAAVV